MGNHGPARKLGDVSSSSDQIIEKGFEARYPGTCRKCREYFEPGTRIFSRRDGYAHIQCPDPLPAVRREVCTKCFQEKAANGSCGCE